jgi:hypothetical protein
MSTTASAASVLGLDASTYVPHALHRGEVAWLETNCYVDLWIELLHALGHEPLASLGFTVRTDLEADQWTFYKQSHSDLETLYGIEVIELNPWTTVLEQVVAEVRNGRIPLVEVDSWFLPDTLSTAYKQHHVKTTIGVETIDVAARRLGYFHNAGYYAVEGDDFDGLFVAHDMNTDDHLVPYVELAKIERARTIPSMERQADVARRLLSHHVSWMPTANPFTRYRDRYQADVEQMREMGVEKGGERFHLYAFAYFRQFGAAFFDAACHLRWLGEHGGVTNLSADDVTAAADAYDAISGSAKMLQLRTARAALTGKPYDGSATIDAMAASWQRAADLLRATAAS